MKRLMYVSGVITLLLLALTLTGWADSGNALNSALREGQKAYAAEDYETALALYEDALAKHPDNAALHYNAAQAAYRLGADDKALEHYGQSGDSPDRYLSVGNIHYRAASADEAADGGMQQYSQALEAYRSGIVKYPQNVPLKYNYELVQAKLEALSQEAQQEQSEQDESQDGDEGEEQENQQSQQQDNTENEEEGEQEQQDGGQDESAEQDEAQQQQQQQSDQQAGESGDAEQATQGEEAEGLEREAIERILQMLEGQEEESLKNNQEVVGGNEDKNGW